MTNTPTATQTGRPLDIELTAEQMNALYFTGYSLIEAGRYQDAANALRFLLLCEPLHIEAWQALGICHESLDDPEGAAKVFEAGFRLGGEHAPLGLLAARALLEAGDPTAARELVAELWTLDLTDTHKRAAAALTQVIERNA